MSTENALVSIVVITYNSSRFVLETLESAKAQTYADIELIISDDASQDNTVEICRNWLKENKEYFKRTELVTVKGNTGIPANCNRGIKAAKGNWIKLIAGDDILMRNCITDNINYIIGKDIKLLFSQALLFSQSENSEKKELGIARLPEPFTAVDAHKQFLILLRGDQVFTTPTSFLLKSLLEEMDYFDEEFRLLEDYPFWIKSTRNGNRIFYMEKPTVLYRTHEHSVSLSVMRKESLVNRVDFRNKKMKLKYIYPYYSLVGKLRFHYTYFIDSLFIKKSCKQPWQFLYILMKKGLNPFHYLNFILLKLNTGFDPYFKKAYR